MPDETDRHTLVVQRRELCALLQKQEYAYEQLRHAHEAPLNDLQARSDALAQEFKQCYAAATQAFNEYRRADAKSLSLQGKELQRQCVALNTEANALRTLLKEALEAAKKTRRDIMALSERISVLPTRVPPLAVRADRIAPVFVASKPLPVTPARDYVAPMPSPPVQAGPVLGGFDATAPLSVSEVQGLLDRFPRSVVERVAKVSYFRDEYFKTDGTLLGGRSGKHPATHKWEVQIFRAESRLGDNPLQTLAHELGHVLYADCLNEAERKRWGELFVLLEEDSVSTYGSRNEVEDFCEHVGCFMADSVSTEQKSPIKTSFLRKVFGRMV